MIRTQTLFVLGAGASFPYGFPLGPTLRLRLSREATSPDYPGYGFLQAAGFPVVQIDAFRLALSRSWSASIDSFLSTRLEHFADIGKAAILYSLAECEREQALFEAPPEDDWFRHLWRAMHDGATSPDMFGLNTVRFITFNYDRSVEHAFTVGIMNAYGITAEQAWPHVPKIVHVYGQLGDYPAPDPKAPRVRAYGEAITPDRLKGISTAIQVIPELKAARNIPREQRPVFDFETERIRSFLADAQRLIFLGFSYDLDNLGRLDIREPDGQLKTVKEQCQIFGSGYGLELTEANLITSYFGSNKHGAGMRLKLGEDDRKSLRFLRRHIDLLR